MGELDNVELEEGLVFKVPLFQTVKEITIQPITLETDILVNEGGAITKDNQTVGASITLFYKYKIGKIAEMYRNIGRDQMNSICEKTIMEAFKKTLGQYTIFEIAMNQQEVINKVSTILKEELLKYPIDVEGMKITNFDWSDNFDTQIQETMNRAQQVKQKEQELLITEQEANKLVKQAESEKRALITKAEGEYESAKLNALAKEKAGEGIRKYNEQIAKTMNIEITFRKLKIEQTRAERFNGVEVTTNNFTPIPLTTKGLNIK
jgi:prohibitin 1